LDYSKEKKMRGAAILSALAIAVALSVSVAPFELLRAQGSEQFKALRLTARAGW
jgi:hypothetical protein